MRPDGTTPVRWRRSRFCQANGACVEVARMDGPGGPSIAIRDGTLPAAGALALSPDAWRALVQEVTRRRA